MSSAFTRAFFPKSRSDLLEALSRCCRSFLARCGSVRCRISVTSLEESSSLELVVSMVDRTFSASLSISSSVEIMLSQDTFWPRVL